MLNLLSLGTNQSTSVTFFFHTISEIKYIQNVITAINCRYSSLFSPPSAIVIFSSSSIDSAIDAKSNSVK